MIARRFLPFSIEFIIKFDARRNRAKSSDGTTSTVVANFVAEDACNAVTVDETGVISLSSRHMRETPARFSELLMVDRTHKTNMYVQLLRRDGLWQDNTTDSLIHVLYAYVHVLYRYNYQLCTIMAMDEYGEGRVVQHSLFKTSADWHVSRAIDHFVRTNPAAAKQDQVIVVDKDLQEIKVLRAYLPEARLWICTFHVIKWLALQSRKPEYVKISIDDHAAIDDVVHNMVYAWSDAECEVQRSELKKLCDRVSYSDFYNYMERNWHPAREMYTMHFRANLSHFRNHTNNLLESFFGNTRTSAPDRRAWLWWRLSVDVRTSAATGVCVSVDT